MKKIFKFFADPGHGWLKVDMVTLKDLNIANKITPCSYRRNDYAYLEEDCDTRLFIESYIKKYGFKPTIKESWTNRYSKIRNYFNYYYTSPT